MFVVAAVVAVVVFVDLEQDKALWVLIGRNFLCSGKSEKSNLFILSEKTCDLSPRKLIKFYFIVNKFTLLKYRLLMFKYQIELVGF